MAETEALFEDLCVAGLGRVAEEIVRKARRSTRIVTGSGAKKAKSRIGFAPATDARGEKPPAWQGKPLAIAPRVERSPRRRW